MKKSPQTQTIFFVAIPRWFDQWQRPFYFCCPGSGSQIQELWQHLQSVQLQQSAFPPTTSPLQPLGRHAFRTQPLARGLSQQSLPKPAASRPAWTHGGVLSRPARLQVPTSTNFFKGFVKRSRRFKVTPFFFQCAGLSSKSWSVLHLQRGRWCSGRSCKLRISS